MCTILSVDSRFWMAFQDSVIKQIYQDARLNSDGFSLVGIDPTFPENDLKVSSMRIGPILNALQDFFDTSSMNSRVFLHSRMATTMSVGIGFNHGFDDRQGRIIMHNGILRSGKDYAVDSYLLADIDNNRALNTKETLQECGETYANVFTIDTVTNMYSVVRLTVGSLYTDGLGNYSTNPLEDIDMPVAHNYAKDYVIGPELEGVPSQDVDEESNALAYGEIDPYEYKYDDEYQYQVGHWSKYKYR
jgi:hypothetical protein